MELFIYLILAIFAFGVFASYWTWRVTKSWPMAFRLLVLSFVIALTITPSAAIGHGLFIVPVIFILIDSIWRGNSWEFCHLVVIPVGVVGGAVYVISAIVAVIRYFVLKGKAKHTVERDVTV